MSKRSLRLAPFALALAALALASPALAEGHAWGHYKHRHHGCDYDDDDAPRYTQHYHAHPVYRYYEAPVAYYEPVYHVHHYHPFAVIELPAVVFHASIGVR